MSSPSDLLLRYVVARRLDKVADAMANARRVLTDGAGSHFDLAVEHLDLAEESCADAVDSLKYNNPAQAWNALEPAFYGVQVARALAAGASAACGQEKRALTESEEKLAYLAAALSKMKAVIEYNNCCVSKQSRRYLDLSMGYYNQAMAHFKESVFSLCKRCCQAGLIDLHLAELMIKAQNPWCVAGWGALANPRLVQPLRKAQELVDELAQIAVLHADKAEALDQNNDGAAYDDAFEKYDLAVGSLASDNVAHAQALVLEALDLAAHVKESITGIMPRIRPRPRTEADVQRRRSALLRDLSMAVAKFVERGEFDRRFAIADRCENLRRFEEGAARLIAQGDVDEAERHISAGLFEIDLIRNLLRSADKAKQDASVMQQ